MSELCLNIGAGLSELEGYTGIDRTNGQEGYPLPYEDNSVAEIYASHVLEHFSHQKVSAVVNHWVSKLKPGGRLRIAVPDFEWIAKHYLAGEPIMVQSYVMGGHQDEDDHHGTIFDRDTLMEIMANAHLERLGHFESIIKDDTSLEVSLNLQGFKPSSAENKVTGVHAVLSAPRFGPVMHMRSAFHAFAPLKIPYRVCQGAYWHQILCEIMELVLVEGAEYVLTCDYDSVFGPQDVAELWRLAQIYPDADAICAVQTKRNGDTPLFGMIDANGKPKTAVYVAEFERNLTRINTGHFGLTLFRATSLKRLPRPWMCATPNDQGRWTDGKVDADMMFWHKWRVAGLKLFLANRVRIGHLQEMIAWPGADLRPFYQTPDEYADVGIPPPKALPEPE